MEDYIYYCSNDESNKCPKKDICKRFLNSENQCTTTLYKMACTKENKYILFIESDEHEKGEGN